MRLAYPSQEAAVKAWLARVRKHSQLHFSGEWDTDAPKYTPKELDVYASGRKVFAEGFVIYSYGTHFPLARWIPKYKAFVLNVDRYSNSTSKHQSIVRRWVKRYSDTMGFRLIHGDLSPAPIFHLSFSGESDAYTSTNIWLPEFDSVDILEYYHRRIRTCADMAKRARLYTSFFVEKATDWIAERNQFVQTFREPLAKYGVTECPELPKDVQSTLVLLKLTQQ